MPDEVVVSDLHPGTPQFVDPTNPATEWTLARCRAALEAMASAPAGGDASAANQQTQITAEQAILAKLTADPATQATLAALLAKVIAAPATSAKQDTQITAEQAILAKIIAAPSTEAKQDSLITANHADLAAILAKLTAGISDAGAAWTSVFGVAGARFTSANASAAVASVTDAPTSGQKLVITDLEISVDTAMRVDVKEETSGTVLASAYLAANSTVNLVTRSKRKLATANKKLQIQTSVAGNISVGAFYYSEA